MAEGDQQQEQEQEQAPQGKKPFEIRLEVSEKGIRAHYPEPRVLEVLGAMDFARTIIKQKALGGNQPKSSPLVIPRGPLPRM